MFFLKFYNVSNYGNSCIYNSSYGKLQFNYFKFVNQLEFYLSFVRILLVILGSNYLNEL